MTVRTVLTGLVVDTNVELAGDRLSADADPPDLTVQWVGQRSVGPDEPPGRILQGVTMGGQLEYCTAEQADGSAVLRLNGLVDFDIAADRRSVLAWTDPACEPEMLAILVAGNLLAMVLALRGETVLHASAVEVNGQAVAFVAHSGMGKSTLATLACARGARFVTDDLLRLRADGDRPIRCWPGSTESRLRCDVAELAEPLSDVPCRTSVDDRVVWSPPATNCDAPPLRAVVLPSPSPDALSLHIERLPPATALLELTAQPRILGWIDPAIRAGMFRDLSRLVRAVPVWRASVPWGPPFDPAVIDELLQAVGLDQPAGLSVPGMPTPAG